MAGSQAGQGVGFVGDELGIELSQADFTLDASDPTQEPHTPGEQFGAVGMKSRKDRHIIAVKHALGQLGCGVDAASLRPFDARAGHCRGAHAVVEPDNRRLDLLTRGDEFATTASFLGKASQQSFGHTGADTHHEEAVPGLAGGLHHRVDGLDFTIRDEEHVIALCAGQGQRRQNRLVHLRATQVCLQFLGPAA